MFKSIDEMMEKYYKEFAKEGATMEEIVNALDELVYRYEESVKKKEEKKAQHDKATKNMDSDSNPVSEDAKKHERDNKEDCYDDVSHPSHYCQSGGMECIDEMILLYGEEEVMSFCKLNSHKYRHRALYKGGRKDIEKSNWYLAKYKELKEIVEAKNAKRHEASMKDMRNLLGICAMCDIDSYNTAFMDMYKKYFG